ncbi:14853_t:CDS:2 [Gigaspora margarita]|uniref:14853_t:CDS:1 n=1 Tax=Gigaspora margarita TaxID=4874 RepID=A0ABN7VU19_GIGMA|nr:14853_t:CDS:2 [Gigaspora margarita]
MEDFLIILKEFIRNKIQNDNIWKSVKIINSGHDVPGEEHKIIKYIRNSESNSDCIYGRLILLGLLHYKKNLRILSSNEMFLPGNNTSLRIFELKLLGILHKKINDEFSELWKPESLPFEFNIESTIKDFILLMLFMGNDFVPMLPNIDEKLDENLNFIISTYKEMLKECGGYIYDAGSLNKKRLGIRK